MKVSFGSTVWLPLTVTVKVLLSWPAGIVSAVEVYATKSLAASAVPSAVAMS